MIYKGFKFGMLLQLAVGPMCFMVFNTSTTHGFLTGLLLVLAIVLIDGLYITLSGIGLAVILNKEKIKFIIKIFGCIVLVLFGLNIIMGVLDYSFLPNITLFKKVTNHNIFIQGLLLTASNPLTIIFWSGVFSSQVIENELNKKRLYFFGFGCVLSTLVFLSIVALSGSILKEFLPDKIILIFNVIVGSILILFGIKLLFKK